MIELPPGSWQVSAGIDRLIDNLVSTRQSSGASAYQQKKNAHRPRFQPATTAPLDSVELARPKDVALCTRGANLAPMKDS